MLLIAIILFVVGALLLTAEMFLPGGVLGIMGALALIVSVVLSFWVNVWAGAIAMGVLALATPILVAYWPQMVARSRLARGIMLPADQHNCDPAPVKPGQRGVAVSELRPGGACEFDGERVSATAERGGIIPAGTPVCVIECIEGRAVVRALT